MLGGNFCCPSTPRKMYIPSCAKSLLNSDFSTHRYTPPLRSFSFLLSTVLAHHAQQRALLGSAGRPTAEDPTQVPTILHLVSCSPHLPPLSVVDRPPAPSAQHQHPVSPDPTPSEGARAPGADMDCCTWAGAAPTSRLHLRFCLASLCVCMPWCPRCVGFMIT